MTQLEQKSRYAQKLARRQQMYGPDCCGHNVKVPRHPRSFKNADGQIINYWWLDEDHVRALKLAS